MRLHYEPIPFSERVTFYSCQWRERVCRRCSLKCTARDNPTQSDTLRMVKE